MQILTQNETHALTIEKVANEWWLELIEKKRGTTQILYCKTKKIAENFFKQKGLKVKLDDGTFFDLAHGYLSFEKIKHYYEKIGIRETKMYKENLDFSNLI